MTTRRNKHTYSVYSSMKIFPLFNFFKKVMAQNFFVLVYMHGCTCMQAVGEKYEVVVGEMALLVRNTHSALRTPQILPLHACKFSLCLLHLSITVNSRLVCTLTHAHMCKMYVIINSMATTVTKLISVHLHAVHEMLTFFLIINGDLFIYQSNLF